jgi:hypothetical protein
VTSNVARRYFFKEPGGNCLNIFCTPVSGIAFSSSAVLAGLKSGLKSGGLCWALSSKC